MQRAYSLLTVKSIDSTDRTFTGIATTPSIDRQGDVVESTGATYRLPIPLLLHHNAQLPVGEVVSADVRSTGITIRGRIASIDEPGAVRDRLQEAWHSLKTGLIKGLSIGFRALPGGAETMRNGGTRWNSWELMEVSLVPIPANADATITAVKSYAQRRGGGIPLIRPFHLAHPRAVKLISSRARR